MPQWTREQSAAIELRNANLLISAAAGSGKTAVLVERIKKLVIEDKIGIDQMLIVTYTNAAAGEMRGRIEMALASALEEMPEHRQYLQRQIRNLNRAHIKTFHAFCLDILRNHFHKVDIDPSFKLMSESDRLIMIDQVIEQVMEYYYELGPQAFVQLVEAYSSNRDDRKLRDMVLSLYHFIQSQPYPLDWLESQVKIYEESDSPQRQTWFSHIEHYFKREIAAGIDLIKVGIALCHEPSGPLPYAETLANDKQKLERLLDLEGQAFEEAVNNFSFETIKRLKKGEKESMDESLIEEVKGDIRDKAIKKQLFEPIKQFYAYKSHERFLEELDTQAPLMRMLYQIVETFTIAFDKRKRKRNQLDFNDLEHLAIKILEDTVICDQYKRQFEYVFVDEYQDASGIQETILNRITRPNNRFMVGDIKQSIYKFRLADPMLFLDKYKTYTQHGHHQESDPSIRIDLSQNFRTRGHILEGVNHLFEKIMSESFGDVDYDEAARLNEGMAFEPKESPAIEINLISKSSESESDDDYFEDMKNDEIEARAIVRRIKALIGSPIFHPKAGVFKPCHYKDIVILIRSSKSWAPIFESVFLEEGIPLFADSQSGYFDALEIHFMLSLIKVVSNPYLDIEMLTVLRSPIVGLSIESLIKLKADGRLAYDGLKTVDTIEVPQSEKDKMEVFVNQLEKWRFDATYKPIDELIWQMMHESKLYEYAMAMPAGASREANLRLLIDRASQFKNAEIVSLTQFVHFIEALNKSTGDMGVANAIGENDDVVRLMSFHKSKGLEFPVVILAGTGRQFNLLDTRGDLLVHKDLGIGLSFVDIDKRTKSKTLPQWVMKSVIKNETLSEEMRVLYVGLTRPVDQLIVFATFADVDKRMNLWSRGTQKLHLYHAQSFMDWMMAAWLNDPLVQINILKGQDFEAEEDALSDDLADRVHTWYNDNKELPQSLIEGFERISHEVEAYTKSKVSVSELKAATEGYEPPRLLDAPSFLRSETPMSQAEIGTLSHRLIEHIDFSKDYNAQDLLALRQELVDKKLMRQEEANHIQLDKIAVFLASDLGKIVQMAHAVYKETPFVLKKDKQLVQGIIDLYCVTDKGIVLIDFKTDQFVSQKALEAYKEQLYYYKEAIEKITGQMVYETYLVFLTEEKQIKVE